MRHIQELDGLRGIAILLVVFHHVIPYHPAHNLIGKLVNGFAGIGWAGVDLFFVLSGFLITSILVDAKGGPSFFTNFYARRILRIFPLYYVWLALCTLVFTHFSFGAESSPAHSAWMWWLYISNYQAAFHGDPHVWIGLFWSLAVEEHFYLVWPAIIYFTTRRSATWICCAIVVAASCFRLYFVLHGNHWAPYYWTPCRMDDLALGSLIALVLPAGATSKSTMLATRVLCSVTGLVGIVLTLKYHAVIWGPVMQLVALPCFGLFFSCLLLLMITPGQSEGPRRAMRSPILSAFGRYSYGMYIFHPAVAYFVQKMTLLPARMTRLNDIVAVIVTVALTYGVAYLSYNFFERHFLALKRYFEYRTPAGTEHSAA